VKRIVATALAVASTAAVAWAVPPLPDIPGPLKPAAREALAASISARGVQIYECRATNTHRRYSWRFVAPEADLFDENGEQIGLHGAGPFWQAVDGSRIVGEVKARVAAPTFGAIPWLLLVTHSTGPVGRFSHVTSIQRIDTVGGPPPSDPCTTDLIGVRVRMPYTATYRLFSLSQDIPS
jgi:hypothetical protein